MYITSLSLCPSLDLFAVCIPLWAVPVVIVRLLAEQNNAAVLVNTEVGAYLRPIKEVARLNAVIGDDIVLGANADTMASGCIIKIISAK